MVVKLCVGRCQKCNFTKSFRLRDEKLKLRILFFFFFMSPPDTLRNFYTFLPFFMNFFWVKAFLAPLGSRSCGVKVHWNFKTWPLHCVVLVRWAQFFRLMQPAVFLLAVFWEQHCSVLRRVIICSYMKQPNLAKLLILLMIWLSSACVMQVFETNHHS